MNEQLVTYLIDRVEKIDEKVDKLLEFKWKVIGGTILASIIITGLMQVLFFIYK